MPEIKSIFRQIKKPVSGLLGLFFMLVFIIPCFVLFIHYLRMTRISSDNPRSTTAKNTAIMMTVDKTVIV